MATIHKLRRLNKDSLGEFIRSKRIRFDRRRRLNRRIQGVPPGLTYEIVDRLCNEQLGEPLKKISYVQLSAWRISGPFRLFLQSENGHSWQLIYKSVIYDLEELPALRGLPIQPGPPEFQVYNQPDSTLSEYLPAVYDCREIIPGKHYEFILEDLTHKYQKLRILGAEDASVKANLVKAVDLLPKLHRALSEWSDGADSEVLLRYDQKFAESLPDYAQNNLESYSQIAGAPIVSELNRHWPEISALLRDSQVYDQIDMSIIHGDYHSGHILVHKEHDERIKILDWEWAGSGLPHFDLATILQNQPPDLEQIALAHYADLDERLSLDEHKRLYYFCLLQRGLLNAAYIASQQIESSRKTIWASKFINHSISRALYAQERLV